MTEFCTIIASNYTAHCAVLWRSLIEHQPDARLTAVVLDPEVVKPGALPTHPRLVVRSIDTIGIDPVVLNRMRVLYRTTELATAIKPSVLLRVIADGASTVTFLDPDILVTAAIVHSECVHVSGPVLTPHTLSPVPRDGLRPSELTLLRAGCFNAGYVQVAAGDVRFLQWWSERLITDALDMTGVGLFTDQRWLDLAAGYFHLNVCRDPGMNVAYWNLHERPFIDKRAIFFGGRRWCLRFVHFSGFDWRFPEKLSKHTASRARVRLDGPLKSICDGYREALLDAGVEQVDTELRSLSQLPNGYPLTRRDRLRYRAALQRGSDEILPDPLIDGGEQLSEWLSASRHKRLRPWRDP